MELESKAHLRTSKMLGMLTEFERLKSINDDLKSSSLDLQQRISTIVQEKNEVTSQFQEYRSEADEIIRGAKNSVLEKTTILREHQAKAENLSNEVRIIRGELILSENFEKHLENKRGKNETEMIDFQSQTECEVLQKSKYDELEKKYYFNLKKNEQLKMALEVLKKKRKDLEQVLQNKIQMVDKLNIEISSLNIENQQQQTAVVKIFTKMDDFVALKKKEFQDLTSTLKVEEEDTTAMNPTQPVKHEKNFQDYSKLSCDLCDKQYLSKQGLKFHITSFHMRRKFKCKICSKTFAYQQYCYVHIKHEHSRPTDFKRFAKAVFQTKEVFATVSEDRKKETIPAKSINQVKHVNHKGRLQDFRKYTCNLCGKKYQSKQAMTFHKKNFHAGRRFKCKICLKNFASKQYCYVHIKRKHSRFRDYQRFAKDVSRKKEVLAKVSVVEKKLTTPTKPIEEINHFNSEKQMQNFGKLTCDLCGKQYQSKQGLAIHKESVHANRKFECKICSKIFSHKQTCSRHVKYEHLKYTDFKDFIKSISQKKKEFQLLEAKSPNEKRGITSEQKTKPIQEVNHKENMQDCSNLTCNLCGKQYQSKQGLILHKERFHVGKKFKCQICSSSFAYKQYCVMHIKRMHSKNKDYYRFVKAVTDKTRKTMT